MLAELRAQLPDVDAMQGTAEAIPVEDHSVAAVFVGEAFHWFQTVAACREIERVLSPGGGLAVIYQRSRWSTQQLPWLSAFDALVAPYRRSVQGYPSGHLDWRTALAVLQRVRELLPEAVTMRYLTEIDFARLV